MQLSWLRYIVRRFGMVLSDFDMLLYIMAIGFITGCSFWCFCFFGAWAFLTLVFRYVKLRREDSWDVWNNKLV